MTEEEEKQFKEDEAIKEKIISAVTSDFKTRLEDVTFQILRVIDSRMSDHLDQLNLLKDDIQAMRDNKEIAGSTDPYDISKILGNDKPGLKAADDKKARRSTIVEMVGDQIKSDASSEHELYTRSGRKGPSITVLQNPSSKFTAKIKHLRSPQGVWELLKFLKEFHKWSSDPSNAEVRIISRLEDEALHTLRIQYKTQYDLSNLYSLSNEQLLHMMYATVAPEDTTSFATVLSQVRFEDVPLSAMNPMPWCNAYEQYYRDFLDVVEIGLKRSAVFLPQMRHQEGGLIYIFLNNIRPQLTAWQLYNSNLAGKKYAKHTEFVEAFTELVLEIRNRGKDTLKNNRALFGYSKDKPERREGYTPKSNPGNRHEPNDNRRSYHKVSHMSHEDMDESAVLAEAIREEADDEGSAVSPVMEQLEDKSDQDEDLEEKDGILWYTPQSGIQRINYVGAGNQRTPNTKVGTPVTTADRYKTMPCFNLMKTKQECKGPKCNFNHDHAFIRSRVKEMYDLWFPTESQQPKTHSKV